MTERRNISSNAKWESLVGYSRAVRVGNIVHIAGTVATDEDGNLVGENDPYAQAYFIFKKIEKYLNEAGAGIEHVVRTRMYVSDVTLWEGIGRAHHEFFADVRPVSTLVEVAALIDSGYLVEIEAEAIIHG